MRGTGVLGQALHRHARGEPCALAVELEAWQQGKRACISLTESPARTKLPSAAHPSWHLPAGPGPQELLVKGAQLDSSAEVTKIQSKLSVEELQLFMAAREAVAAHAAWVDPNSHRWVQHHLVFFGCVCVCVVAGGRGGSCQPRRLVRRA